MPRKTDKPRPFYTCPEAAERLGIHRNTALRMAKSQGHLLGVTAVQATKTKLVFSRVDIDRLANGGDS